MFTRHIYGMLRSTIFVILAVLFVCPSPAEDMTGDGEGEILFSRNGLAVNVKYDPAIRKTYLDFNFLAEESDLGFKSESEIRKYIESFPEMMGTQVVADKVIARYPRLFEEERLRKEALKQKEQTLKFEAAGK